MELAVETAMRQGELLSLTWANVDLERRVAFLPETKNGTSRYVPLSSRAVALLAGSPRSINGQVFPVTTNAVRNGFVAAVSRARRMYVRACLAQGFAADPSMFTDLRFHDLRHEATSRLFERGLNPMQVAAITGHKTLQMLKRYTHLRAEDLARMLD